METIRPFVLRRVGGNSLVPPDSEEYNEQVEQRISFVQSSNIFVVCMLSYQCIRYLYYFYYYITKCPVYAYLCMVIIAANGLWILTAGFGFLSINSRALTDLSRYYCLMWIVIFSRLVAYFLVWALMKGYSLDNIKNQQIDIKKDASCATQYQGGLMMFQAIVETVFIGINIYFIIQIRSYLIQYEENFKKKLKKWNVQASLV